MSEFPSFLRLNNTPLFVYITLCLSIHTSMDMDYFHLLAIVNYAAIKMGVQVTFYVSPFSTIGYIPRTGIVGSYGNSVLIFFRNCQTFS